MPDKDLEPFEKDRWESYLKCLDPAMAELGINDLHIHCHQCGRPIYHRDEYYGFEDCWVCSEECVKEIKAFGNNEESKSTDAQDEMIRKTLFIRRRWIQYIAESSHWERLKIQEVVDNIFSKHFEKVESRPIPKKNTNQRRLTDAES